MISLANADLADLVARASTLWERLQCQEAARTVGTVSRPLLADRQARWRDLAAGGDEVQFRRRLAWEGIIPEYIEHALGVAPTWEKLALPPWATTLCAIIEAATGQRGATPLPAPNGYPPEPLPFEELFAPALTMARRKLLARLGLAERSAELLSFGMLTDGAYAALEHALLHKLTALCAEPLYLAFQLHRPPGLSIVAHLLDDQGAMSERRYYNLFVAEMLADGLLTFFRRYPVLGRLVAISVDLWVEGCGEFLERLRADDAALRHYFGQAVLKALPSDPVTGITCRLSDPHHGGRTVLAVNWASGRRAIYKPRDMGQELSYARLLAWCNHRGVPLPFRPVRVLRRTGYGWVEIVDHQACEDAAAADRLFRRSGMLLCLLYALAATDVHRENVIVNGEHPVLIDVETLLHLEEAPATGTGQRGTHHSVLCTGLLPEPGVDDHFSGLGVVDGRLLLAKRSTWKAVNTDFMSRVQRPLELPVSHHEVLLHERVLAPSEYLDAITDGFRGMYDFLIKWRQELLAPGGPLQALASQPSRFLFRDTAVYISILTKSLHPAALEDGVAFSIELERLSRAFLLDAEKPSAWPILAAELRALEQLDIPSFTAAPHGSLCVGEQEIRLPAFVNHPAVERLGVRLRALDEDDREAQVALIVSALQRASS